MNGMRAIHRGEILREEYLEPMGLSASALASIPCSGALPTGDRTRNDPRLTYSRARCEIRPDPESRPGR